MDKYFWDYLNVIFIIKLSPISSSIHWWFLAESITTIMVTKKVILQLYQSFCIY